MGASARPGEEEQVEEPEQTGPGLSYPQDVLPTTLQVRRPTGPGPVDRSGPSSRSSGTQWKLFMMKRKESIYLMLSGN